MTGRPKEENQFTGVADRIGSAANIKYGTFDQIVAFWEDGGPRLPCLEMDSLAKHLIGWMADGDVEVVRSTFVELEHILEEYSGDQGAVISSFVGPCLLEALDDAISQFSEIGREDIVEQLYATVFALMGNELRVLWSASR